LRRPTGGANIRSIFDSLGKETQMTAVSNGQIVLYETLGTMLLLLLGCGVVANVVLRDSKGFGGGWLLINFGWGLGVYAGVYGAFPTGAHLNPAVTVSQLIMGNITAAQSAFYFVGEFLGAFLGAVVAWLAYKVHFDVEDDPAAKLAVFSTGPAIRTPAWNLVTEVVGTFVLIFGILASGGTPTQVGPLFVALLVVGIGASLGGPTGYAINPARDLAPRIAHALLPIRGKGPSDWGYAWVPVVGPIIGSVLATLLFKATGAQSLIDTIKHAAPPK
jgi:glycerol uptake facilitator protein